MIAIPLILAHLATSALGADEPDANPRFRIEATVLVYDTESGGEDAEIDAGDVDSLRALLAANSALETLRLNSGGGSIWAAEEMARIVTDYELDTEIDGECSSSCVRIFLGGAGRRMTRGSKLGLHSRWWAASDVEGYYERNRETENWDTPFEFGSWIYKDTQGEVYEDLAYDVRRGVDPGFAIEMHAPRDTIWYPPRADLEKAGVLRE